MTKFRTIVDVTINDDLSSAEALKSLIDTDISNQSGIFSIDKAPQIVDEQDGKIHVYLDIRFNAKAARRKFQGLVKDKLGGSSIFDWEITEHDCFHDNSAVQRCVIQKTERKA